MKKVLSQSFSQVGSFILSFPGWSTHVRPIVCMYKTWRHVQGNRIGGGKKVKLKEWAEPGEMFFHHISSSCLFHVASLFPEPLPRLASALLIFYWYYIGLNCIKIKSPKVDTYKETFDAMGSTSSMWCNLLLELSKGLFSWAGPNCIKIKTPNAYTY